MSSNKAPVNDAIIVAVARLVDDAQSGTREPSHSDLEFQINRAGLNDGDPKGQGQVVGKAKRVRATLSWGIDNAPDKAEAFLAALIGLIRGKGGFRAGSSNFVGEEAILDAREVFRLEGFVLSDDGELFASTLDNLSGVQMTGTYKASPPPSKCVQTVGILKAQPGWQHLFRFGIPEFTKPPPLEKAKFHPDAVSLGGRTMRTVALPSDTSIRKRRLAKAAYAASQLLAFAGFQKWIFFFKLGAGHDQVHLDYCFVLQENFSFAARYAARQRRGGPIRCVVEGKCGSKTWNRLPARREMRYPPRPFRRPANRVTFPRGLVELRETGSGPAGNGARRRRRRFARWVVLGVKYQFPKPERNRPDLELSPWIALA
jgi:hypothetical protein